MLRIYILGPKLTNAKTRQFPTAGAPVSFEAFLAQPASQPAPQPASQAHDRLVLSTLGISGPVYIHTYIQLYLGLSGPLWASLGLSVSLCASVALWASLGLSGLLWASLGHSTKDKTMHNRQLDPQFSLGVEVARRQDHTIAT